MKQIMKKYVMVFLLLLLLSACSSEPVEVVGPITSTPIPPTVTIIETLQPSQTIIPSATATNALERDALSLTATSITLVPSPTPRAELWPVSPGRIAFFDAKTGHISVTSTDGKFLGDVADVGGFIADSLTWSPDGKWIAFGQQPSNNREIYIARPDGSESERITYGPHNKYHFSWSWDGQYIAYSDDGGTGFENDIEVLDIASRETWKLTYMPGIEQFPAWSPDGKLIAFLYSEALFPPEAKLFVMNTDGSDQRIITDLPIVPAHLSWSPDSKQIAFSSGEMGCGQIYVVSLEEGELTQLTNLPSCADSPTWSPDGRHIAFNASEREKGNVLEQGWQIYIMNADGSGITQLTSDRNMVPLFPYWAPEPSEE